MRLGIVGATGMVGRKFLEVLEERGIIPGELILFASKKSAGKTILFNGKEIPLHELCIENIRKFPVDYALFSAGGDISREYAGIFSSLGTKVVDNSSAFRMDPTVPLIVPEVNRDALGNEMIISNPNCSTIQSVIPVGVINDLFGAKRVYYTTYQAVSGSGVKGVLDLEQTEKGKGPSNYSLPIHRNVIPAIDRLLEDGYTFEEEKMIEETRKILGKNIFVNATCCRVPVLNGHSVDVVVECGREVNLDLLKKELAKVVVIKEDLNPLSVSGSDEVYVGRIRLDRFDKRIVRFFCVADNIRKGAATNTVQILECLLGGNENV